MKKRKRITVLKSTIKILLLVLLIQLSNSTKGQEAGLIIDQIIGKVDNYIVLQSDLEKAHAAYLASGNPVASNSKCQLFAQLISGKLMVAKAEIDSVIVTDIEVDNNLDRRMQLILSQYGGSESQLEEYYGKSIDQIKGDIRDEIKEQLVVSRMQETIIADIKVTPAEVRRFYNRIPKDSLPFFSTEVEVGQIVKIPEVGGTQKEALKIELRKIRDKILAGEDFEALAKEYSQGPSARYGGNLGFTQRGMMASEFEAAALQLRPGEISSPFETQFGIHIVQLLERRGNEYNSRHILLIPKPSEDDIDRAKEFVDSLRTLIVADSITFQKAAKDNSDDKYTAGNGGFFEDRNGGSFISSEDLDPVIFFTIDTIAVGSITKPIIYRMDDGKEAVRVLFYKSKVKPHEANLAQDWQKIQTAALNEKKSKMLNDWFNKAREDVFISIGKDYEYCNILQ
ncbi:MAG: peptidylprolyl isomerase [Bacteroidota bacterium]